MFTKHNGLYWEQDSGNGSGAAQDAAPTTQQQQGEGEPQAPESWEAFLEQQAEGVRTLYQGHTQGLRSALDSERQQRREMEKQIKELAGKAEKGSALETQLQEISAHLEAAEQRVAFYESAPPELANAKLGWLAAQEIEAFDRRGNVNWDAVKAAFPELFNDKKARAAAPPANAGSGQGATPKSFDMNDALRQAAGRNAL